MKKVFNIVLLAGTILSAILLFWPFARWNNVMALILRIMPSVCVQVLLCRISWSNAIRLIPPVLTGVAALWGVYLYFTSPAWNHVTVWGLIVDYVSPFISCAAVFAFSLISRKSPSA